jgi:hypothetical protein
MRAPEATGSLLESVNVAALQAQAIALRSQAERMQSWQMQLLSLVGTVTAGGHTWVGPAAESWTTTVQHRATDYGRGADQLGNAAATVTILAGELSGLQSAFRQASADSDDASRQALQLAASPDVAKPAEQHRLTALNNQTTTATGRMQTLNTHATAAAEQAAARLRALTVDASSIVRSPLHAGTDPVDVGWQTDHGWAVMLLGSVVGNRIAGRLFQDEVLRDFGLPENFARFAIPLPGGARYTTIPDGEDETIILETKGALRVYNSLQLRAEVRLARITGRIPELVVQARSRVSSGVQQAIREAGGNIRVRVARNLYRDYNDKDAENGLFRRSGGRWERLTGSRVARDTGTDANPPAPGSDNDTGGDAGPDGDGDGSDLGGGEEIPGLGEDPPEFPEIIP